MLTQEFYDKIQRLTNIDKCNDENYDRNITTKKIRDEIKEEQKDLCWLCKCKTTVPIIHHIKPDGSNNRDNLVMLCSLCHKWVHWILKKYLGYRASIDPHKFT